ncbi:hypothetical protein Cgig2_030927 [Carnegiea gigantea]|uniref:PI31 proteasome regulator N-terminal domain-containing protein n=1 Tax=Carnegiea gigantea TaxID=171969 RepID=A0A9Q1KJG4_9CARY|nr:hypothetical protein Cgig2_030927 [Carnegiea gigantea]
MATSEKSVLAVIRASRPSFRNNHDKVAFAVHASFLAAGFVLTATGPPAFAENALSSSASTDEVGIDHWNELDDEYAFLYVNPERNKKVLVKCLVMGDKLMVDALSDGASEPVHIDIDVHEFVAENAGNDYNSQYKNLGKLVCRLDKEVLSKLDGSSAGSSNIGGSRLRTTEELNRNVTEPRNVHEPLNYEENPAGYVLPAVNPVGGSDLFPGAGAGVYPSRGDFGGGSMLVAIMLEGPEDPRWFGGRGGFSGIPGSGGPNVPPGARFDPYGPPDVPGFGPGPGQFGRFPRGPVPGTGTHPDFQPGRGGRLHPDLEQPGSGDFDFM